MYMYNQEIYMLNFEVLMIIIFIGDVYMGGVTM